MASNTTERRKLEGAPDPPVILSKAKDGRGDMYTLKWRVADNNEDIQVHRFLLSYSQITNMDQTKPGLDQKEVTIAKGAKAYTITDLLPGKFYRILLYSENTFGVSEEADINIAMPDGIHLVPTTKHPHTSDPYTTLSRPYPDGLIRLLQHPNTPAMQPLRPSGLQHHNFYPSEQCTNFLQPWQYGQNPPSVALPQSNLHAVQPMLPGRPPHQSAVQYNPLGTTTPVMAMTHHGYDYQKPCRSQRLQLKNLEFDEQLLGEGAQGIVSSVKFKFGYGGDEYQGFKEAAAKLIRKEYVDEAHIMLPFKHSNIVRVLGIVDARHVDGDIKRCYIIMEKGEMSLYKYIKERQGNLTKPLQGKWALDICKAVKYIHGEHIVHRDIKPANVIVFQGDIVKLADFGISKKAITTKTTVKGGGTPLFIAPEVITDNRPKDYKATFSKASDIYSLGVLLWQLFSKDDIPAPLLPSHMDPPYDFPESLKVILPQTWETDPHKRPNIAEVISALKQDLCFL